MQVGNDPPHAPPQPAKRAPAPGVAVRRERLRHRERIDGGGAGRAAVDPRGLAGHRAGALGDHGQRIAAGLVGADRARRDPRHAARIDELCARTRGRGLAGDGDGLDRSAVVGERGHRRGDAGGIARAGEDACAGRLDEVGATETIIAPPSTPQSGESATSGFESPPRIVFDSVTIVGPAVVPAPGAWAA